MFFGTSDGIYRSDLVDVPPVLVLGFSDVSQIDVLGEENLLLFLAGQCWISSLFEVLMV